MSDKQSVLEGVLEKINSKSGDGSIFKFDSEPNNFPSTPSGSLSLDHALGIGGLPKGRIIEYSGLEMSGKTSLALHAAAETQKTGGIVAFIDAEHALDPKYAKAIGVDIGEMYISQPNSGEQALDICEQLVRSGAVDLIVIDSVAALVPEAELTGEFADQQVGLHARLMSKAMRKLIGIVGSTKTSVLFINQVRALINTGSPWGPKTTTTGGMALKFYASVRVEVKKIGTIEESVSDKTKTGNEVLLKVVKNKLAPPFRECRVDLMYGKGIEPVREVVNLAVQYKIIKKSGAWFSYGETKLGQGLNAAVETLRKDEKLLDEITILIKEKLGLIPSEGDGHEPKRKEKLDPVEG